MLKLSVFPICGGTCVSAITLNGRGRPTACLMVLTTSGSPRQTTRATITTHIRPRVPAFQIRIAPSTISTGTNKEFPLKNGMSRSKIGLDNARLIKRNSATSSDWSQSINQAAIGDCSSTPGNGAMNEAKRSARKRRMSSRCHRFHRRAISVRHKRPHRPTFQLFTALQKAQLDKETDLQDFAPGFLH